MCCVLRADCNHTTAHTAVNTMLVVQQGNHGLVYNGHNKSTTKRIVEVRSGPNIDKGGTGAGQGPYLPVACCSADRAAA